MKLPFQDEAAPANFSSAAAHREKAIELGSKNPKIKKS